MNGRLYDPAVGRFLSSDPVVKDPGNSQHYNRYSYCLNNPLKYTDPSGYTQADMWTNEMTESMRAALGAWATALGYTVSNGMGSSSGDGFVGSGSKSYGRPGQGDNGTGLNGTYYDWYSGTYRSTDFGNSEVSWNAVYYNLSTNGYTYSTMDMGRHDQLYGNAYRPNPEGKIRLFVIYNDYVASGAYTGAHRDWLNKTQIGMESYGLVNSSKEELFEFAAKTDETINSLRYVKGVKLVSKGLVIAGAAATVYEVYNDAFNKGYYYSAGTRLTVAGIAAGSTFIPFVGWAVAGGIGLADAIWGDKFYNWVELNLRK